MTEMEQRESQKFIFRKGYFGCYKGIKGKILKGLVKPKVLKAGTSILGAPLMGVG